MPELEAAVSQTCVNGIGLANQHQFVSHKVNKLHATVPRYILHPVIQTRKVSSKQHRYMLCQSDEVSQSWPIISLYFYMTWQRTDEPELRNRSKFMTRGQLVDMLSLWEILKSFF
jgi:hypothetical protein